MKNSSEENQVNELLRLMQEILIEVRIMRQHFEQVMGVEIDELDLN